MPFFVWDEQLQQGNGFGERLANAIESVLKKGFEKVIVIGNDCLTLNSVHIHEAVIALQSHEHVLAPTKKGGSYLIGLTQKSFNKELFTTIRWQSSFTNNDLDKLFSFSVFHLPVQDDVNNYNDLREQVSHLITADTIRMYVVSIIASFYNKAVCNSNFFFNNLTSASGLRAPPALSQ